MPGFGDNSDGADGKGRLGPGLPAGWPGSGAGQARPDGRPGQAVGAGETPPGVRPGFESHSARKYRPGAASFEEREQLGGGATATGKQDQPPAPTSARRSAAQAPAPVKAPTPTLPTGGGAIRSIAEKFSANPATGSGSMAVPIALPAGRDGFGPELTLGYDSGSGNSSFGLGWQLGAPSISRKTDKGIPRYRDTADTFILSGAEDLVPLLIENMGDWERDEVTEGSMIRRRYRPRIEGAFARIERITDGAGNHWWETVTRDNVTSIYGKSPSCRIARPKYPGQIFRWLLEETRDDRGNVIRYEYKAEDLTGVARSVHEAHRHGGTQRFAGAHLKRILYGNKADVSSPTTQADFHFEVVFDYGEHDVNAPTPDDSGEWLARQDPFSSHRAGFEVRNYRLCRRVLVFHRFSELGPDPLLVRSTDLSYEKSPALSYLRQVTACGYVDGTTATRQQLPPVDFDYSRATLHSQVQDLDAASRAGLAHRQDGRHYQWVDLDGEGVVGALTQQSRGMFYKRNLGQGRFALPAPVLTKPTTAQIGISDGTQQLLDVTGDGLPDLVDLRRGRAGYHPRKDDGSWGAKVRFQLLPNLDWADPALRFIDLTGDGRADVVMAEEHVYRWYPSEGKSGYGPPGAGTRYADPKDGPNVVFAEAEQTVFLADMTGDGLQDIVRIRNGSVCYWPNQGYGDFGAQVIMTDAPHFGAAQHFDPSRVRLADIDGSGTADLLYVGADGVAVSLNQAGNSFAPQQKLAIFPDQSGVSTLDVVDLLGSGTACLVWSTPIAGYPPHVRYVDLLASQKPHLLTTVVNNLGLQTTISYTTSTKLYLQDKAAGIDWATRLPFPVQVVERVEHHDEVSTLRLVSTHRYRHGFYDAEEREFRGFGYVESRDAEQVSEQLGEGHLPPQPIEDGELVLPPVVTKTWFHTGAWQKERSLFEAYEREWFDAGGGEPRLSMPPFESSFSLSPPEQHQAHRALAGRMLRQEVYAEDGSAAAERPYVVTQQTHGVRALQPAGKSAYASFLPLPAETLTIQYERLAASPRYAHELTVEIDELGYVTKSASVGYGLAASPYAEQQRTWVLLSEEVYSHHTSESGWYRHGLPISSKAHEPDPATLTAAGPIFTLAEISAAFAYTEIDFDAPHAGGPSGCCRPRASNIGMTKSPRHYLLARSSR